MLVPAHFWAPALPGSVSVPLIREEGRQKVSVAAELLAQEWHMVAFKCTFPQTQAASASFGVKSVSSCSRAVPGNLAENNPEAVNAIYIINHYLGKSHLGFKKKL